MAKYNNIRLSIHHPNHFILIRVDLCCMSLFCGVNRSTGRNPHRHRGEHAVQPDIQHKYNWLYNCYSEAEYEKKDYFKNCKESVIMDHMLQGWDVSSTNSLLPFIIPDLIHPHIHSCYSKAKPSETICDVCEIFWPALHLSEFSTMISCNISLCVVYVQWGYSYFKLFRLRWRPYNCIAQMLLFHI